jgi:hypothetical protein
LARFLESFASIANKGGDAKVGFTRDAKDRITNANLTVTTGTAEMRAVAHPVTLNTRTKGGDVRSWPGYPHGLKTSFATVGRYECSICALSNTATPKAYCRLRSSNSTSVTSAVTSWRRISRVQFLFTAS